MSTVMHFPKNCRRSLSARGRHRWLNLFCSSESKKLLGFLSEHWNYSLYIASFTPITILHSLSVWSSSILLVLVSILLVNYGQIFSFPNNVVDYLYRMKMQEEHFALQFLWNVFFFANQHQASSKSQNKKKDKLAIQNAQ